MPVFEETLKSNDGLALYTICYTPDAESAQPVVCLVHGLGEHSGRYAHVAQALNQAGYPLCAFDLRGHGRSAGARGHTPSFEAYMADIDVFLDHVADRFPGRPQVLYGHSLGGLLVLSYTLQRMPALTGVIATGPGLRSPLSEQRAKVWLARSLSRVAPAFALSSGLDPNEISRDAQVVEDYRQDPLVHDRVTFMFARSILENLPSVFENAASFPVPLLIMHGSADRLTFADGSREFAQRVGRDDCTLKIWDGLYHELHNEPERAEVLSFVINWLDQL